MKRRSFLKAFLAAPTALAVVSQGEAANRGKHYGKSQTTTPTPVNSTTIPNTYTKGDYPQTTIVDSIPQLYDGGTDVFGGY